MGEDTDLIPEDSASPERLRHAGSPEVNGNKYKSKSIGPQNSKLLNLQDANELK